MRRGRLMRLPEGDGPERDRVVDFLRGSSLLVVIIWHWSLSVVHWTPDGRLAMPNPIPDVPLGWLATWVLQVVPVFFVVGGYANIASWRSVRADGKDWREFYRRRIGRLAPPVAVFLAVWLAVELVAHLVVPDYRGITSWGLAVLAPLWFVAAYAWVILLVPLTAVVHERGRELSLAVLAAAVVLVDLGRFQLDWAVLGWVNTGLVWVFVHQLGYFYRDGGILAWDVRRRLAFAVAALTGLIVLTALDPYPASMVAHRGTGISHLLPTTAGVAVLAVFQLALVLVARPALDRWLARPFVWRGVVAVNRVILTAFVWHMTALLVAILAYEAVGFELSREPTGQWWARRPLWILLPAAVLAGLLALFHRAETRPRR